MKRALAYIRVSSREQGKRGFGLQSQRVQIEEFAKATGHRLMRVYTEVASAIGRKERPELCTALREAKKKGWPILISRLDRLSRDSAELEELVRRSGVDVIAVDKWNKRDPISLRVEGAKIAQDTLMLKERTMEGIRRKKQQGFQFGNRTNLPEAQRKGTAANKRNADIRTMEIEALVRRLQRDGITTGQQISERLNQNGYRTARGQAWTDANVRRVLRRAADRSQERKEATRQYKKNPDWGRF